ncbi:hypothetical protein L873DRAFT_1105703 [Choiromyces venosus 120613-1]|uniref:Helitron helicase-like domain-containing protein n=1 Tax=Choiromyces venosus 120613-1 TaxID=1336337 RepID=A0A3N4JLR9_9PEZI|nr:hypothetical protein L873DRAFT_1105703 [Choiromyces venosus 120613-1]
MNEVATIYVKKTHSEHIIMGDIRNEVAEGNSNIANCLTRWAAKVPSLAPFWHSQHVNLLAICLQYRSRTLFCTFSAADLHWPILHNLIEQQRALASGIPAPDYSVLSAGESAARHHFNLCNYPHIVASFLHERFKLFRKTVVAGQRSWKVEEEWW